jgi:two-component system sensor histidine kinase QseC
MSLRLRATRSGGSLRHRLARNIALMSTISVVLLALLLDKSFDHQLQQRFDAGLSARASAVAAYLGATVRNAEPLETWMPEFREAGHTDFYQVWDTAGRTLARSASSHQADLPLPKVLGVQPHWFDLHLPDGHHGRAVALAFDLPDGDSRGNLRVVVAEEREQLDALMVQLHVLLLVGAVITLALVLMLSHWSLRRGLAPLDVFATTLATTRPEQPAAPLYRDDLPLELMPLARKFDHLLARVFTLLDRERRFARDLAHELRTPVAETRALAETSAYVEGEDELRRRLRAIADTSAEMERTMETLLALARIEAGLDRPATEPLDLVQLVREVLARNLQRQAVGDLHVLGTFPTECWILGDVGMLERLLDILIGNALEHAPRSEPDQQMYLALQDDGSFCLRNAAPQLDENVAAQLGRRFLRIESNPGSASRHSGLGLSLAAALAEAHGLNLRFDWKQGQLEVRISGFTPLPD